MSQVLCINVGSSTVKGAVFDSDLSEVARVTIETSENHAADIDELAQQLNVQKPSVVAHRVVHGGPNHGGPAAIDDKLVAELAALVPLAPLHMPPALTTIDATRKQFVEATHVACFDTAFHRTIPDARRGYALPSHLTGALVQRYGFHGLSCEHVVAELSANQLKRCVIAHLGSGCSVTAIRDGKSADTTMGFSPTGGVVMGTRPGDLDPGVIIYLLEQGHDVDAINHALNKESGLLALAGTSDMRTLVAAEHDDKRAADAIDIFCSRVAQQIGAYAVTLGGLDTVAFTGGIGEHQAEIRDRITSALSFLSPFEVVVVAANEELVMARQSLSV